MRVKVALCGALAVFVNCSFFAYRSSRQAWQNKEAAMAQVYFNQGVSFYNQEQFDQALVNFDLAAVWDPDNQEIAGWLDRTHTEVQKKKSAALLAIGEGYYKNGNYIEALGTFEHILAVDSTNQTARTYRDQSRAQLVEKPPPPGRQKRERSALITEHLAAGLDEYARGNYDRAIAEWQKVFKLAPDNEDARAYIDRTKDFIEQTIITGLVGIDSLVVKGRLLLARKECDSLVAYAPTDERIAAHKQEIETRIMELIARHTNRGKAKFDQADYAGAETEFRKVLTYDPKNATAQRHLREIKAKQSINRADAEKFYYLGIEAYTADDFLLAISYWEKVLVIDPGNVRAQKNIERARQKHSLMGG